MELRIAVLHAEDAQRRFLIVSYMILINIALTLKDWNFERSKENKFFWSQQANKHKLAH